MPDRLSPLDGPGPDLMNDPQYATNTMDGDDGGGEADTCRICRTEGDASESLFHPCKCSGSIKYVHQDCLMEWLSHSQKKHCELCKTPFRFTKLYSPNMPQTLPFHLLIRHVFLHGLKNMGTWLRFGLVVFVWLGCLPFVIRQVWRLLFWFSDGGWPINHLSFATGVPRPLDNQTDGLLVELLHEQAALNTTSPVSPLLALQTTPAFIGSVVGRLAGVIPPVAQLLNVSDSDPLVTGFFKVLLSAFGAQHIHLTPESYSLNSSAQFNTSRFVQSSSTLLSEVQYLQNITRYTYVNHMVISIVEGYVITISVVISFILVFLIREWVVQQQPGINMGAGFNADFAPVDRDQDFVAMNNAPEPPEQRQRIVARPRRRVAPEDEDPQEFLQNTEPQADVLQQNRPSPVRDALSPAAEIQRRLTEEPRFTEDFLSIWRRSEGNPDEVLRIIEAEDKMEQMNYWVKSMRILQRSSSGESSTRKKHPIWNDEEPISGSSRRTSEDLVSVASSAESSFQNQFPGSGSSNNASRHLNTPPPHHQPSNLQPDLQESSSSKGKEKATDEMQVTSFHSIISSSSGTRPRAISEGPHPSQTISPLASGTWTFDNVPNTAERMDLKLPMEREQQSRELSSSRAFFQDSEFSPVVASPMAAQSSNHDVWKREQDLLVQRAVEKGRELRRKSSSQADSHYSSKNDDVTSHLDSSTLASPPHVMSNIPTSEDDDLEFTHDGMGAVETPTPAQVQLDGVDVRDSAPAQNPPILAVPAAPRGLLASMTDFFWGENEEVTERLVDHRDDQHIVHDIDAEPPFIPVAHDDDFESDDEEMLDDADLADPGIAEIDLNDPDAIDDAEDFEGIMELVGMRGPMFSLLQNAIFSAFLLSLTVAIGIWIPYNIGRITLLLVANPGTAMKMPLKLIFGSAAFVQDVALSVLGIATYALMILFSLPLRVVDFLVSVDAASKAVRFRNAALLLSEASINRVSNTTVETLIHMGDSDIFAFSAASHESLIYLEALIENGISGVSSLLSTTVSTGVNLNTTALSQSSRLLVNKFALCMSRLPEILSKPESWVISLEVSQRSEPLDLALSVWSGTDRFWAVVAGYAAVSIAGVLYVRKGTPFSTGQVGREWEDIIIDLLNQAGGVFKVILIISIEMLVFPLYCGLLLDVALLPLFENATIMSRVLFTCKSPLTSVFVHWFIGTCYMFHFALFVSMCRKIMRKGVLYFIRDPDDPTFHPVRDVLERNIATQLRKILFSALVYGALVIICLGGVVWGLSFAFNGVLPIHWSSNEPVLEFPVDLLFYNFLMPLAVRFFKPSDVLHSMYTWWFRRCARMLRLTWFMFDEREKDEEGYHVRRTWAHLFRLTKGNPDDFRTDEDHFAPFAEDPELDAYFHRDGRYVRAPASDQVRIPKGQKIFLDVDENNKRIDGEPDILVGIHGSENTLYKHLYVPPWFRLRIFIFILSIWLFAAVTGVSITIAPLVFGRYIFVKIIPTHVRKNDVYAFSIGIYILGSALYAALHLKTFYSHVKRSISASFAAPHSIMKRGTLLVATLLNFVWTYTAFIVVLPALFAACVEFYFIVPLHSYFALEERHVVHFVQSWTLGLLYVKLTTRLILWYEDSRQAQTLRAITRNGYLSPDARLATRCFILPLGLGLTIALAIPWTLASFITTTFLRDQPEIHVLLFRYSYPLCLCMMIVCYTMYLLLGMLKRWQMVIRDEVYLIGERLHNFGERKSTTVSTGGPPNMRRIET